MHKDTLHQKGFTSAPQYINSLWSNPSLLFNRAKSLMFSRAAEQEIVPEGDGHRSPDRHCNHPVFNTIPIRPHTESRGQRETPRERNEGGRESHFNECFNLAAVPVQRRAPYQRWMAFPPSLPPLPPFIPSPPLGSAERSYSGTVVIHYIWLWK